MLILSNCECRSFGVLYIALSIFNWWAKILLPYLILSCSWLVSIYWIHIILNRCKCLSIQYPFFCFAIFVDYLYNTFFFFTFSYSCHCIFSWQDASVASSAYINHSTDMDKDIVCSKLNILPGSMDYPRSVRTSYSTLSFSMSRFSAESSGTDCLDSGISPFAGGEPSSNLQDHEVSLLEARNNAKMRYKEKKKSRL